jgi:polyhydroxyalkanoate synthesis regulator phasin
MTSEDTKLVCSLEDSEQAGGPSFQIFPRSYTVKVRYLNVPRYFTDEERTELISSVKEGVLTDEQASSVYFETLKEAEEWVKNAEAEERPTVYYASIVQGVSYGEVARAMGELECTYKCTRCDIKHRPGTKLYTKHIKDGFVSESYFPIKLYSKILDNRKEDEIRRKKQEEEEKLRLEQLRERVIALPEIQAVMKLGVELDLSEPLSPRIKSIQGYEVSPFGMINKSVEISFNEIFDSENNWQFVGFTVDIATVGTRLKTWDNVSKYNEALFFATVVFQAVQGALEARGINPLSPRYAT